MKRDKKESIANKLEGFFIVMSQFQNKDPMHKTAKEELPLYIMEAIFPLLASEKDKELIKSMIRDKRYNTAILLQMGREIDAMRNKSNDFTLNIFLQKYSS